ncbi:hypothetical protein A2291_00205 [candidate division WOR-1 bacterium RIFOXYB2_FULL_42_35]|uniref:Uncharacterized protein n=1 Tax=candidate division WOR-1 bacterium RIFOXYC2_FULL_41_25 TaxID=1802586 RepID=A0A1F4TMA4_UNCSA|nr:MAG: hypothetical protein A2247_05725 [candidate division WOR-1 bacterium RIFOXYA2_FULL_41_14]OGC24137.1 MAG: hypothetical protein A2291_00205 [candidate division WOR-1 bacterium RIFOXYB2_FULL_42_35]OGC33824.1 MAG: hypothetical protein A2462_01880 [candidate division WOR-1 bacterium RIFOXYC2_FULL_41_25]OGC41816.1 MAG: hypothetical protein A2548_03980 [candidate division WOR-1 bacterium RIFOXYD2_FULL_41_8]
MIKNILIWFLVGGTVAVTTVGVYYVKTTTAPKATVVKEVVVVEKTKATQPVESKRSIEPVIIEKTGQGETSGTELAEAIEESSLLVEEDVFILETEKTIAETVTVDNPSQALSTGRNLNFELGFITGFYAAAPALNIEIRLPLSYVVGPTTSALRLVTGLSQTESNSRRYIPFYLDTVFYFPPGYLTGVENYLGFGLNYVALTSGRKSGTVGGQIFYGVESDGFTGRVFGEIGYGLLCTGFSPSQKGLTVLFGFRKKIAL